jgi:hypothetical protein
MSKYEKAVQVGFPGPNPRLYVKNNEHKKSWHSGLRGVYLPHKHKAITSIPQHCQKKKKAKTLLN